MDLKSDTSPEPNLELSRSHASKVPNAPIKKKLSSSDKLKLRTEMLADEEVKRQEAGKRNVKAQLESEER